MLSLVVRLDYLLFSSRYRKIFNKSLVQIGGKKQRKNSGKIARIDDKFWYKKRLPRLSGTKKVTGLKLGPKFKENNFSTVILKLKKKSLFFFKLLPAHILAIFFS